MRGIVIGATFVAGMILMTAPIRATEKYSIIDDAELIVVGTIHHPHANLWFDGAYFSGTIDVQEVLFGNLASRRIDYRGFLPCEWFSRRNNCELRRAFSDVFVYPLLPDGTTGMWFLRPGDHGSWVPTQALGLVGIDERQDFEAHIRQRKR